MKKKKCLCAALCQSNSHYLHVFSSKVPKQVPLCCFIPVKLSLSSMSWAQRFQNNHAHAQRHGEGEREEREGLNPEPNTLHGNVMAFTCSLFITENEWMADTRWQMINFWCKFPFLRCKKWKVGLFLSLSLSLPQSFRKILLCFWGPLSSVCLHSERSRFSEFSFWGLRSFAVGERKIRIVVCCVLLLFLHSESHFLLQVTNPKHALGFCVFWWWWFCCFQKWENLRCLFSLSQMMMTMILLKLVKKKNHQMKFFLSWTRIWTLFSIQIESTFFSGHPKLLTLEILLLLLFGWGLFVCFVQEEEEH